MIITVSTPVYPTESVENVKKAVTTLFPLMHVTVTEEKITGTSEDKRALNHLKELLEKQKIRSTANDILKKSVVDETLIFYLNKQAALMEKVNFSRECPLGPITVRVTGTDLTTLIDELSPRA